MYLVKPPVYAAHHLQQTGHLWVGDTIAYQMQGCESEYAAMASASKDGKQLQLNICIPSILELFEVTIKWPRVTRLSSGIC